MLVCPDCQVGDWQVELDRCSGCDSTALVRRLGDITCRSCGAVQRGAATHPTPSARADPALEDEVAQALGRLFRRG